MSHQPFETWIFEETTLSLEERRRLQAHLDDCGQCQRIDQRWQAARQQLRAHAMVAPAPGFTQRWQAGLTARKAHEQRRQAWRIFSGLLGGAALVLSLLGGRLLATTSAAQWLSAFIGTLSSSLAFFQMVLYMGQRWLAVTPPALHLALWIYLTMTLCGVILIWAAVLWRTQPLGETSL